MDWKKNDVFQVRIEDMSDTGEGIGKTDGFIWFVKDARSAMWWKPKL